MADRSDPVVILAAGQSGDAVFFSIHAHASEFQDVKLLAVFGQSFLPVKGGPAVPADQDRDHDHQRGKYDQGYAGNQYIKCPLDKKILGRGVIALQHQDRQVEHVNGVGALHEQVAHTGNDICPDIRFHAVFDDLVSVMAVNAAEETLWEGDYNVDWDLPDGDPNREWGGGEGQDVTSYFIIGEKINVYLTVAGTDYHKCQFDTWEWEALPGVDAAEFSADTKVTIEVTEDIAAAVAKKGFRLHGHGFHVTKVTKGADDDQPAIEEEDLWSGDYNVDWDLPDGDPNREWGGGEGQDVTANFVTGAKIFVYLTVAGTDYHKCQFDNWEWEALPGISPAEFSEDTKVTIEVTDDIAAAVAEKGFRLHGHGFHVTKVSKAKDVTGIKTVTAAAKKDGKYYNLNGQVVTNPTKGLLYILNGRKIVLN